MYKSIPGYPDYMINEYGEVCSIKNSKVKILKQSDDGDGYYKISLFKDKKVYCKKVHRLLGITFLNCSNDMQIDHIDGDRSNNSLSNLRIVTSQENHFNRTTAKGCHFYKPTNRWMAYIVLNKKKIHLGYFDTEEDAHAAYLKAKEIYHVIEVRS
tara:strand:- start:181 stop:645 length:465 start_codon:yes stop_codon:yes gene_type:complete